MQTTIFDTPVIRSGMAWLSAALLRVRGWKIEGQFPDLPKYVMIAAPHTTNWDFPIALGTCFALRNKIYWMGKHSLFKGPMGPLMRWLGGISVNRSRSNSLVQQVIDAYREADRLVVVIPPEGTRKKVTEWKTGFYHIAVGAGVPVVLAYVDFPNKRVGVGPTFYPSGDLDADMREIRAFYQGFRGKHPDAFAP